MSAVLLIIVNILLFQSTVGLNSIGKKTLDIVYFIAKNFLNDEICYECPGKLEKNSDYRPYPNGCGSYGFHIEFNRTVYWGFDNCCNHHDMCYQDCHKLKDDCDKTFMVCMREFCERLSVNSSLYSGCHETLVVAHRMVRAFGCSAYKLSKKLACKCVV